MSFTTPIIRSSIQSCCSSSIAGPSSLRTFSSTSSTLASKRKLIAKRRKATNLALQSSKIQTPESVDPVLGRVHYRQPTSRSTGPPPPESKNQWEESKLSKILLNYDDIAYSPPPNYTQGERPKHLLPGISKVDEDLLFGVLPHISTELKYSQIERGENQQQQNGELEEEQNKQSEMLLRILDLRNSSKSNINVINRQRVIDEFGEGVDTGSSRVQAALLTAKIHNLLAHITQNPKDTSNKRSLRLLTQQRARHLKYFKNNNSKESYDSLLGELGLEQGAVEGELRFSF